MKQILILLSLLSIFSCKKNTNLTLQNINSSKEQSLKRTDSLQFKPIGKKIVKEYDFPKEWTVNTYSEKNIKLEKEDIDAQNKFEEIDYFSEIKVNHNEQTKYSAVIKKDSLLKLSHIDSLSVVDSYSFGNNKNIVVLRTVATLDDENYEIPLKIYKLDLVFFNKPNDFKTINMYSEINYPFSTVQNICYLNNDGKLYCKKFNIEEDKVYYKGQIQSDLRKYLKSNEKQ